jgi:hypothetical protein
MLAAWHGCMLRRLFARRLPRMVAGAMMICMLRGERTGEGSAIASAEEPGEAPTRRSDRKARRVISSRLVSSTRGIHR